MNEILRLRVQGSKDTRPAKETAGKDSSVNMYIFFILANSKVLDARRRGVTTEAYAKGVRYMV